jgi:hypothetical protein
MIPTDAFSKPCLCPPFFRQLSPPKRVLSVQFIVEDFPRVSECPHERNYQRDVFPRVCLQNGLALEVNQKIIAFEAVAEEQASTMITVVD